MILSHKHRFIFIKTLKTAGTSLEIALSKYCGPDDIITRIKPEDEQIRRDLGCPGPQNMLVPLTRYTPADWRHLFLKRRRAWYVNHMPAATIRARIGASIWDSYTRFTIERNPWDCAVSRYYWDTRDLPARPSISEFLVANDLLGRLSNFPIYSIDGELAVDHVIRYEDLDAGLEWLTDTLRLPEKPVLPRAKTGARVDKRPYADILSEDDRAIITRACAHEIALFGYEF